MSKSFVVLSILLSLVVAAAFYVYKIYRPSHVRAVRVLTWLRDPASHPELVIAAGSRCGSAAFIFPTRGVVGFLWDDSFRPRHRHQGIDIFSGREPGVSAVIAVYPGYLTRRADWKASLIVRVPDDPLQPGRQIWVYYTHMADANGRSFIAPQFPPGTYEKPVQAGDLLGYTGNYSGDAGNPVGVHLHISIVRDRAGQFMNELDIRNTYDPSPYFGMALNARQNPDQIPTCTQGQ